MQSTDTIIASLRAAGEPTRLRLLRVLSAAELTVTELTQILGQSQPRVSRHLKLLTEAGLVERIREGTWAFFRLADGQHLNDALEGLRTDNATLAKHIVDSVDNNDPIIARDLERLASIKEARQLIAAEYFNNNAEEWGRIRALYLPEEDVEAAMLQLLVGARIADAIDLGTGTGRILEVLSHRIDRGIGIDLSREMLAVARSNLESSDAHNCHVRQGDIFSLPFANECADLVTVHQVLHFLHEPAVAVTEAARLLRVGGRLLIVDFAPHDLEFLRDEHAHRRLGFADKEVRSWCKSAGLELEVIRELVPKSGSSGESLTVKLWLASPRRGSKSEVKLEAAQ